MTTGRIDVHNHYMGGTVAKMIEVAPPMSGGFTMGRWTTTLAMDFMDRHDIATQMLSLPIDPSGQMADDALALLTRTVNHEIAELVKDHPNRFGGFAVLPLSTPDAALKEIAHALDELGLDGVLLPSNARGTYLGQEWFEPILAELARRKAPTFIHPADPPGVGGLGFGRPSSVIEFPMDTARTVTNAIYGGVFRRHPDLNLILAHAGGVLPTLAWRIGEHLSNGRGPNDDRDVTREHITDVLAGLHYDVAISPEAHSLLPLLACAGPDHILFGSDWPAAPEYAVTDADEAFEKFDGLSEADRAGVRRTNAERLFPRLAG